MRLISHTFVRSALILGVLAACLVGPGSENALAEEFLGVEIEPKKRIYVVTRDVNVRAKPETKSERIDGLKKGSRVSVVGRYKGWLAIEKEGKPFGFAYFKYLVPMIEGVLQEPVRGSVSLKGDRECKFEIVYMGKSTADAAEFGMADYDVAVRCKWRGENLNFVLFMFMTEGAYTPSKPSVHQIGIDLFEIDTTSKYDEVFSTNVFFNSDQGKVTFDGVTLEDYAGRPADEEEDAETVPEALGIAVSMALQSWSAKAWNDLASSLKGDAS